jgi:glycosyltransferase involved in cell wall biosynthesis
MKDSRVSVILNSFNQAAYIADAVESVLAQTCEDFELIVVDNGSSDRTREVLAAYERHPKVRLFLHAENEPVTRRFNQAVSAANGEFISFLYSDDCYLPSKLERQVNAFDTLSSDYGVVYGPAQGLNELTGQRWTYGSLAASGDILEALFAQHERGQIDMISPMTRKVCLQRYPFDEEIFAEGEAIFFRIAMRYRFHYLDEPLAVVRDHTANAGKAIRRNAEMTMTWLDRIAQHEDFPAGREALIDAYRATVLRNYGWQAVRTGESAVWARACFARALRVDWRHAVHPRLFAGFTLSWAPRQVLRQVNQWADAALGHRHNSVSVQDFGGSINKA